MENTIALSVDAPLNKAEAIVTTSVVNGEADSAPQGLRFIPKEFLDPRTDEEIAEWLQHKHAVTSEKNVWYFWHTGWNSMKPWVQRGIISSVRRLGDEWTVHFTDNVPGSETHIYNYIDPDKYLPAAFKDGTIEGPTAGQWQGDLIRWPLLIEHGGVWMDAGMVLFRHLDDICWKKIEDPASPYQLAGFVITCRPDHIAMSNGFFASKAGNPYLRRSHEVYRALWADGATSQAGFHKHPLLSHLPLLESPNKDVPFPSPDPGAVTDYLSQIWAMERIRHLIDPNDGFNGPEYWANHILAINMPSEMWRHQITTNWNGKRQWELFSKKRSGEGVVKDADWYEAEKLIHEIISDSAVMKLSAGAPGTADWWLATYWNRDEHKTADIEEGTFAAYLRWASCHFDQIRELVPLKLPLDTKGILHAGYLEPNKFSRTENYPTG